MNLASSGNAAPPMTRAKSPRLHSVTQGAEAGGRQAMESLLMRDQGINVVGPGQISMADAVARMAGAMQPPKQAI